ncbi:DUF5312 family protein [Spirochaeta africana]|uniref:Uncharacterized protein n=1 Tax=Spirochaeta africana (strain ATCC 700263 / DSM 8902 / Z-7692) TaxID=889378 RepID=H9UKA4_SPIAZ|nr:DUF5312 family protein [Spirochaeta africana]AFG37947.1 hypothetical protein Spiaf_1893 [Spirochaeta africana DSM 8902]
MAESVFDTLVQGMSREERIEMLDRIQSDAGLEPDPIVYDGGDPGNIDLQAAYHQMSLLQKILMFFRKLFTGKDHFQLVEQHLLNQLGRRIIAANPGFVEPNGTMLLEGFAYRVDELRGYIQRLAGPLSTVLGESRKQFIGFMFSMIAPTTYDLIRQETDPAAAAQAAPELNDRELKRRLSRSFQDILESLQSDQRTQIYMNYRFLYHLLQLASFPYTQILQEFQGAGDSKLVPAQFTGLEGVLRRLDSQIHSTTEIPSSNVLHLVFVFLEREQQNGDELKQRLDKQLKQAYEAIGVLRSFVREVPLRDIVAFCSGDIRYAPLELSGGEDWFSLFREHVGDIIDRRVDSYTFSRRRTEILSDLMQITGSTTLPDAVPYSSEQLYVGCRFHLSLSIALFVVQRLFPARWLSPLKVLLIDGEFYKDNNRKEYNDAYQALEEMEERITELLGNLPRSSKQQHAEMQGFLQNVDKQVRRILDDLVGSLRLLTDVIDGILFGEVGGRFDTIANLGQINGRSNQKYLKQLEAVLNEITRAKDYLMEAIDLEQTKRRV